VDLTEGVGSLHQALLPGKERDFSNLKKEQKELPSKGKLVGGGSGNCVIFTQKGVGEGSKKKSVTKRAAKKGNKSSPSKKDKNRGRNLHIRVGGGGIQADWRKIRTVGTPKLRHAP